MNSIFTLGDGRLMSCPMLANRSVHLKVLDLIRWLSEVGESNHLMFQDGVSVGPLLDFNESEYDFDHESSTEDAIAGISAAMFLPESLREGRVAHHVLNLFDEHLTCRKFHLWMPPIMYATERIIKSINSSFLSMTVGCQIFTPFRQPDIIDLFWPLFGVDHWIFDVILMRHRRDRLSLKYPDWVKELTTDIDHIRRSRYGGNTSEINFYVRAAMHYCYDSDQLPVKIYSFDDNELPIPGTATNLIRDLSCPSSLMMCDRILSRNPALGTLPSWQLLNDYEKCLIISDRGGHWNSALISELTGIGNTEMSFNSMLESVSSDCWVQSSDFEARKLATDEILSLIRMKDDALHTFSFQTDRIGDPIRN